MQEPEPSPYPAYQHPHQYQHPQPHQYQYQHQHRHPAQPGFGESPAGAVHWLLPTGRCWQSIVAGYVALFALVLWPLGPVALGLGVWALVRASRDGSHGRGRSILAVVVGLLTTGLLLAVIATR